MSQFHDLVPVPSKLFSEISSAMTTKIYPDLSNCNILTKTIDFQIYNLVNRTL